MSFLGPVFGPILGVVTGGFSTLIGGLLGGAGGGGGQQQQQQQQLPPPPPPTPVPLPPDRSDADIQASADRARRAYGISGGRVNNSLTGGIGVPNSQTYGAVTQLLGGVGR